MKSFQHINKQQKFSASDRKWWLFITFLQKPTWNNLQTILAAVIVEMRPKYFKKKKVCFWQMFAMLGIHVILYLFGRCGQKKITEIVYDELLLLLLVAL